MLSFCRPANTQLSCQHTPANTLPPTHSHQHPLTNTLPPTLSRQHSPANTFTPTLSRRIPPSGVHAPARCRRRERLHDRGGRPRAPGGNRARSHRRAQHGSRSCPRLLRCAGAWRAASHTPSTAPSTPLPYTPMFTLAGGPSARLRVGPLGEA